MERAYKYWAIFRRQRAKDISASSEFAISMEAYFSRLSVSGRGNHLLENCAIFLLVSHSLHLRGGRIKEVHAWINNTFQLSTVSRLLTGFFAHSLFIIVWILLPRSDEPTVDY
jgi:hypothetical protein